MPTRQDDEISALATAPPSSVGATLKGARERMGKDLPEVASQLRIRQPYLAALEDGRHKDLPGGTYAVGFLRTYAEFLSLDGEEMVRRFKQEAAGDLNSRAELIFPSPVSEGRVPGGALLFLGLVLAGAAYGGWYWLSSKDRTVAEMVPPIPERLAPVIKPSEPPPEAKVEPAKVEPAKVEPAKAEPAKSEESQGEEAKAAAPKPAAGAEVVPPPEQDEDRSATMAASPAPRQEAAAPAGAAKPAETPKPPEPAAAAEAPKPAEPAAETATPATAPLTEGKVIGQENAGARIVLKAAGDDCWIQVREMDGQLLLSRLLRKGDSYMVPDRPGLTLMVGNAGALEIAVDGKKVPALGAPGQVRRDIKLDADKLAGGA